MGKRLGTRYDCGGNHEVDAMTLAIERAGCVILPLVWAWDCDSRTKERRIRLLLVLHP